MKNILSLKVINKSSLKILKRTFRWWNRYSLLKVADSDKTISSLKILYKTPFYSHFSETHALTSLSLPLAPFSLFTLLLLIHTLPIHTMSFSPPPCHCRAVNLPIFANQHRCWATTLVFSSSPPSDPHHWWAFHSFTIDHQPHPCLTTEPFTPLLPIIILTLASSPPSSSQFGVCPFQWDSSKHSIIANPYSL